MPLLSVTRPLTVLVLTSLSQDDRFTIPPRISSHMARARKTTSSPTVTAWTSAPWLPKLARLSRGHLELFQATKENGTSLPSWISFCPRPQAGHVCYRRGFGWTLLLGSVRPNHCGNILPSPAPAREQDVFISSSAHPAHQDLLVSISVLTLATGEEDLRQLVRLVLTPGLARFPGHLSEGAAQLSFSAGVRGAFSCLARAGVKGTSAIHPEMESRWFTGTPSLLCRICVPANTKPSPLARSHLPNLNRRWCSSFARLYAGRLASPAIKTSSTCKPATAIIDRCLAHTEPTSICHSACGARHSRSLL